MRKIYILSLILLANSELVLAQQTNNAQRLTPAQQLIAATGEDSLNSNTNTVKTVISGYGDVAYQNDFNAKQATIGLKRAVLFVGHQFSNRIAFFSELEVEDAKVAGGEAGGEVAMEQAYVKFSLNPRQYIVAGLFVTRLGITNENHLPINYNGVERPMVEQFIIPSTWRELGVGFYGQSSTMPLTYCVALVNGLDNAGFEHGSGFKEGRAEGRDAGANNLAVTGALQYFAGNWKFQVSGYAGGTTPLPQKAADTLGLSSGTFGTPLFLGEADMQYNNNGFSLKALYCNVSIPEADKINTAYASNTPSGMMGMYGEVGYNLLQHAHKAKWSSKQLIVFGRYEMLDMNTSIPLNGITDGTLKQSHIIAGFSYLPLPNVVIKADVRLMNTGEENTALILNPNPNAAPYQQNNTLLNIGVGYSF